jgi:hypothetical protein
LQDQSAQIAKVSEDVTAARLAMEQRANRIEDLELKLSSLGLWVKIGVSLLVILAVVAIILLIQLMHAH